MLILASSKHRFMRSGGWLVAVLCLAALTGCGESKEDKVASAVEEFYPAAASGDGETACDHIAEVAMLGGSYRRCVAIVEGGILYDSKMKKQFRNVEVEEVIISGQEGKRADAYLGPMDSVFLRKEDGVWKIEAETLDAI